MGPCAASRSALCLHGMGSLAQSRFFAWDSAGHPAIGFLPHLPSHKHRATLGLLPLRETPRPLIGSVSLSSDGRPLLFAQVSVTTIFLNRRWREEKGGVGLPGGGDEAASRLAPARSTVWGTGSFFQLAASPLDKTWRLRLLIDRVSQPHRAPLVALQSRFVSAFLSLVNYVVSNVPAVVNKESKRSAASRVAPLSRPLHDGGCPLTTKPLTS